MGWNILDIAYKFAKEGGTIPSETRGGQLSLFPHKFGELPKVRPAGNGLPPFAYRGRGRALPNPRARARGTARKQELLQKAAQAAIAQQFKMDEAAKAGQITPREIIRQNRILMARRRAAMGM